jgi:uncharacterized protein (DUF2141 family)
MKRKQFTYLIMIAFIALSMPSFCQGTVKVSIEKVKKETGKIYVSMANKANDFKKQGVLIADSKNYNIVFENVPPGVYSIQVCQDENSNGTLDKFMGIPKEPVGFSQNPTLMFGAPSFEQSSFDLADLEVKTLSIKLKNIF